MRVELEKTKRSLSLVGLDTLLIEPVKINPNSKLTFARLVL